MNRNKWKQILLVFIILILIPIFLHMPDQYLNITSAPKPLRTCILGALFALLGYAVVSIFRMMENRDSHIFQKKFDNYQKYLSTLAELMNKGKVSQSDLVEVQQQYANITILMNKGNAKALREVMTQTTKILWHICEAQAKNKNSLGAKSASDINFFKHFNMIARAMQSDIHDCKYKADSYQDELLIKMFDQDILGAIHAQDSTYFNDFRDADFLLTQISQDRKNHFKNDTLDWRGIGKVIHTKQSKNSQEGFLWNATNKNSKCHIRWRKKVGNNLCTYIGGYLSHDYSWFLPCKKNIFTAKTHFSHIKKRLFVILDIMSKQYQAYEVIEDFIMDSNHTGNWKVRLWEYDTVFIQSKEEKYNTEEFGTRFIDITYNFINDEYMVSMGCRIGESDMYWFNKLASDLERMDIFDYHRELRRGYYKFHIKTAEELKHLLSFCLETLQVYAENVEFPYPYLTENTDSRIERLLKVYKTT